MEMAQPQAAALQHWLLIIGFPKLQRDYERATLSQLFSFIILFAGLEKSMMVGSTCKDKRNVGAEGKTSRMGDMDGRAQGQALCSHGPPIQRFLSWRTRRLPAKDQESFGHLLPGNRLSLSCSSWSSRIRCTLFLDSQTRTKGG